MSKESCQQCGEEADPQYTENFDVIDEKPMHFCGICGQLVKALKEDLDSLAKASGF